MSEVWGCDHSGLGLKHSLLWVRPELLVWPSCCVFFFFFCFAQQWQWDQGVLKSTIYVCHWTQHTYLCVQRAQMHLHEEKQRCVRYWCSSSLCVLYITILWCAFWRTLCNYFTLFMLQAILSCMDGYRQWMRVTRYIYSSTVWRYLYCLFMLLCYISEGNIVLFYCTTFIWQL